jgi:integrase
MSDGELRTVADVLDAYIKDRKENVGHPASLTVHLKPLREAFGSMPLTEALGRGGVLRNKCITYCAENSHLAQNTLRKRLSVFQAAFTMAWKKEKISGRPLIHIPPAQKPKQRTFGADQRAMLLKAADSFPTEDHTRTFVYLAVFSGQQSGKILAMTWDQVRFNEGYIYFFDRRGKQEQIELHSH